ncbi:MAG: 2-phosphosulfolactate phosphatase [Clostridia bacterium]|nr:2-phosphosulfolactate phosphatase [Clostridia bacterium]
MRIDVFDTPLFPMRLQRDVTVIAVDPIYMTSDIVLAMKNGAREVIPAEDAEAAGQIIRRLGQAHCILAGADKHETLPGFTIGDDPFFYDEETIQGKSVILHEEQGNAALFKAKEAGKVFIGSFLNAEAVAACAVAEQQDIILLCAGTDGRFSLDDVLCCGSILRRILRIGGDRLLCDLGRTALALYNSYHDVLFEVLKATQSVEQLCRNGHTDAIRMCLQEDTYNTVPIFAEGTIHAVEYDPDLEEE